MEETNKVWVNPAVMNRIPGIKNLLMLNGSNIIQVNAEDLLELIETLVNDALKKQGVKQEQSPFMTQDETMQVLGVKSKTTMWKYRVEGTLAYSMPSPKIILYERESVMDFLQKHKRESF